MEPNPVDVVLTCLSKANWDELHKQKSPECCKPIIALGEGSIDGLMKCINGENATIRRRALISLVTVWLTYVSKTTDTDQKIGLLAESKVFNLLQTKYAKSSGDCDENTYSDEKRAFLEALRQTVTFLLLSNSQIFLPYETISQFNPKKTNHRMSYYQFRLKELEV